MDTYLTLVLATFALVLIPGPNVALIVATSLAHGTRYGLCSVAGTTAGVAVQLLLIVFGLSTLLQAAATSLFWLKWAGVIYLLYLALKAWRTPADGLAGQTALPARYRTIFLGGMGVALVNPKTLLFNAAFLPQFISPHPDFSLSAQLWGVAGIFLSVLAAGDSLWAMLASQARPLLKGLGRWRNKLLGGVLLGASIALAAASRK